MLLAAICALSCATSQPQGTAEELWPGLERGPYSVGFQVRHETDARRSFGSAPRPIQVSVWYPAIADDRAPVSYRAYLRTAGTEVDHSEPDEARATEHLLMVRELAVEAGASVQSFDRQLRRSGWAVRDAEPEDGPFPLLIYAPGSGAPAFQNTVLCEYLASHGFIVAASPSFGPDSRAMPSTVAGVEAQVGDLAFVARVLEGAPNVEAQRVGLIGYSFGGLAVLLHAMSDERVGAVAALDPTLMVKKGHRLAREVPGYAPEALRAPIILMIANARQWPERDTGFFDEIPGTDASLLRFNDFLHGDFASIIIQLMLETRPVDRDLDRIRLGYAAMCRTLEAFFRAALEPQGLIPVPAVVGVPDGAVTIEHRTRSLDRRE